MELKFILEAILFSAQKPLTPRELRDLLSAATEHGDQARPFKRTKEEEVGAALEQLRGEHEAAGRSYRLACVAGAWQFVTQPEYAPWVIALVGMKPRPPRLSQPALETLAIIAYRQPVTRAEIEQVRGVTIDGVMATLQERGLIKAMGRAEIVGHPMTYGTTAVVPGVLWIARPGRIARRRRIAAHPRDAPGRTIDSRPRPGHRAARPTDAGRSGTGKTRRPRAGRR